LNTRSAPINSDVAAGLADLAREACADTKGLIVEVKKNPRERAFLFTPRVLAGAGRRPLSAM
jgi:hypothetical protein